MITPSTIGRSSLNRNRVQKRQHKIRRPSPTRLSKTAKTAALYAQKTAEPSRAATMPAPSASTRQDSCSFRTRLADESLRSDLDDDIYNTENTACLGRKVIGNPYVSPAAMMFPESCDSIITQVRKPKSGLDNPAANFVFFTVEEFADTVMVDAVHDNNSNSNSNTDNKITCLTNYTKKRRAPFPVMSSFSQARKRLVRGGAVVAGTRISEVSIMGDEEDDADEWSMVTVGDISRIPAYGPSDVMKQSAQTVFLRRAIAKAREARRKMRTLERSCRTLFRNAFEPPHVHATKCISVGAVC